MNFTWTLNEKPINDNEGITVMGMKKFSTLMIDSVQYIHGGEYTCIAQNRAGSTSYSAVLNVNGTVL